MAAPTIIQTTPPQSKTNPLIILGVLGVTGFLGYKFLKPFFQKAEDKADLNALLTSTVKTTPTKQLYNTKGEKIVSANFGTIAIDLYNALHPGWYTPTNQDRVIRVFLNDIPHGQVSEVEKIYLSTYGENLRKELADKLNDVNWIKIKNYFR